jgi:hypothetical protein
MSLTKSQIKRSRVEAEKAVERQARLDPQFAVVTPWDSNIEMVREISQIRSGYIPPSTPIDKKLLIRRKRAVSSQTIVLRGGNRPKPPSIEEDDTGPLSKLDTDEVLRHYEKRSLFSQRLNVCFQQHNQKPQFIEKKFIELALGLADPVGNDAAVRCKLGEKITRVPDAASRLFRLAKRIHDERPKAQALVQVINEEHIQYVNIAVGSEMAMMLCPDDYWATNLSIIWAYEYAKRNCTSDYANKMLTKYLDTLNDRYRGPSVSKHYCTAWDILYPKLKLNLDKIGEVPKEPPGSLRNVWNDAVATVLFDRWAPK